MTKKEYSVEWGGRTLSIKIGELAQQASGSCLVRYGDTCVLATATMGGIRAGLDFFPLQVDFEERMYAAGRIKGSRFIKREGRPTDEAVLSGRLIDRAIRPLFPSGMRNEVAVVATVFSHDQVNDGDIPGLIGASCALGISNIPWAGPLAAVRIGRANGQFILNPSYKEIAEGDLDLVVAGRNDQSLMIEAGANRITEDDAIAAIAFAHEQLKPVIDLIEQIRKEVGLPKTDLGPATDEAKQAAAEEEAFKAVIMAQLKPLAEQYVFSKPQTSKSQRIIAVNELTKAFDAQLESEQMAKEKRATALEYIYEYIEAEVTARILDGGKRVDGRGMDDIRDLTAAVGMMPRTHGSGLFNRGETQVLSCVTLASPGMEQTIDTMEYQTTRRYFHHYNFPSYSVGETRGNRGPGRREIGHGALAERAILPVLPTKEKFPYTVRVVSEVLGSNGSSSMGATCGSTLALMDAGVPIAEPVAGIAMGLASDAKNGRWQVITDLQDLEDGEGGMDFKVAGTRTGITAIQMDTKTLGLPFDVVKQAIKQAFTARIRILDVIAACLPAPRAELSQWAPRIETLHINPDKIRDVIGPGGKMINEIIAQCKVEIDIEDDGLVMITSVSPEGMKRAVEWVEQLTREVKAGEIFVGPVVKILDFGAFVEILPKQDGMVHISEIAPTRINKIDDVLKVGDMVKVKVMEIDSMGRINLSMKRADPNYVAPAGGEPSNGRPPRR